MALRETVLTYVELVAAANSGDGEARIELAIVERRMLNQGASAPRFAAESPASGIEGPAQGATGPGRG